MIKLIRTDSSNQDFIELVKHLDADLRVRDGEDHSFYAQFNKIDTIKNVVVAYIGNTPVGCGAFKIYEGSTAEVKRMYVHPQHRRNGVAAAILNELENWANEEKYQQLILETGKAQPEAIALYQKCAYKIIPNYGQYAEVENSVCMKKELQEQKELV